MKIIRGWIPDFKNRQFFFGEIQIQDEFIVSVIRLESKKPGPDIDDDYILPGLIDAHVHIESSMLVPSGFAMQVVRFGTVATVSDPHEIANVLGIEGIKFMVEDAARVPLKIYYTAPSCVPATEHEESGAVLGVHELEELASRYSFVGLGEMMDFPGVLRKDPKVIEKISLFRKYNLPIDGHAPGLMGMDLKKYAGAGISTDHEATSLDEARGKIQAGMKILIREGSAARNFDALWPLIAEYPGEVMLCCDDIHPDELLDHHIDWLIVRGLEKGLSIFDLLQAASLNPINHYQLDVGKLQPGDKADFILVKQLNKFIVRDNYINGNCVSRDGEIQFETNDSSHPNRFNRASVKKEDFEMPGQSGNYRVIGAVDGELFTTSEIHYLEAKEGVVLPDNENDIIRIAVVNRYRDSPLALGWIGQTGLKKGALASSVAHDSHNIIVMGISTEDMAQAVNLIIDNQGGISYSGGRDTGILPLPVAGLMSSQGAEWVGKKYQELNGRARELGSCLSAPFMTLSFMALLVIPELKIGDRGLFDVKEFNFVKPKVE